MVEKIDGWNVTDINDNELLMMNLAQKIKK